MKIQNPSLFAFYFIALLLISRSANQAIAAGSVLLCISLVAWCITASLSQVRYAGLGNGNRKVLTIALFAFIQLAGFAILCFLSGRLLALIN